MELKEVLDEVIKSRKNNADSYAKKSNDLSSILQNVSEILSYKDDSLWTKIIEEKGLEASWKELLKKAQEYRRRIRGIGIGDGANDSGDFVVANNRASRPYINIGIVAAFRQGKSTMLRALLGYDDVSKVGYTEEDKKFLIPTASDATMPCTGTKIHYINDSYNDDQGERENIAIVNYYTTQEVLTSMIELFEKVKGNSFQITENEKQSIKTLQDKLRDTLYKDCTGDEIKDKKNGKMGQPGSPKEALWRYVFAPQDSFKNLGKIPQPIEISTDEGRKFFYKSVCFYEDPDTHTIDKRSYDVLCTKEANIYKRFTINGEDPGKIRFMDTPGVGEARTSVEQTLTIALRNEIDVAIAICKIDDVQIEYINQFNNYIKKDFNVVCEVEGKNYDIKDCLYYVLNVSDHSGPDKIYEHKESTIKQSLSAPLNEERKISGIEIQDSHIVAIDCKKDKKYVMTDTEGDIEGHKKPITKLVQPQEKGCCDFLKEVLWQLKDTIAQIDNYFNYKVIAECKSIINDYEKFKESASNFKLPPITFAEERINLLKRINENIIKNPTYSDISSDKLDEFIKKGKEGIVGDFLAQNTDANAQEVEIREERYADFRDLEDYVKIKEKFRDYFVKKLIECYDINSIQTSVQECTRSIADAMIKAGLGEAVVGSNKNIWFETFIEKYGNDYPILKELFKGIANIELAKNDIKSYVESDLNDCFHQEKSHNDKNTLLFSSIDDVKKLFKDWLEDIADSLISKTHIGTTGVPTFESVVNNTKQKYLNHYSNLRRGLSHGNEGYLQLASFVEANQMHIFKDTEKKNAVAKKWKDLVNRL